MDQRVFKKYILYNKDIAFNHDDICFCKTGFCWKEVHHINLNLQ